MELDSNGVVSSQHKSGVEPEVEIYCFLLSQLALIESQRLEAGKEVSDEAVAKLKTFNRRTLDSIAARVYFYYSLFYEKLSQLEAIRP